MDSMVSHKCGICSIWKTEQLGRCRGSESEFTEADPGSHLEHKGRGKQRGSLPMTGTTAHQDQPQIKAQASGVVAGWPLVGLTHLHRELYFKARRDCQRR